VAETNDGNSSGGGCGGCVGVVLFILMVWALFFGLPVNDKVFEIDIFPPAIRYR